MDDVAAVNALAARHRGPQVVIDALPGNAASQANARTCPSRNDSIVMSNVKCAVAAPENGNEQINA